MGPRGKDAGCDLGKEWHGGHTVAKVVGGLATIGTTLLIAGCSSVGGFPERPESIDDKLTKLQEMYFQPKADVLGEYSEKSGEERRTYRNEVVHGRLLALDMQFGLFKESIYKEGVTSNLTIDVLEATFGAAGTAVKGAEASRILSALSGVTSGTGTAINKNLYYERTLPALLAVMDAKRDEIRGEILTGLTLTDADYPLGRALTDLERYLHAGSIPGAIGEVIAAAGKIKAGAEEMLTMVRDEAFAAARAQEGVRELISLAEGLPEGSALSLLTGPPTELDEQTLASVAGRLGGVRLENALSSRLRNDKAAKEVLKMVLVLMNDRSEESVAAWKAAMLALSGGG